MGRRPGYTDAIGEDLVIVSAESSEFAETEVAPDLKVTTAPGYKIKLTGSLQNMDALQVEYKPNGGTAFTVVGFLTKLSGEVTITPAVPGSPESGNLRAIFVEQNQQFGNFSPEYPVTVA